MIELRNITKCFGTFQALDELTMTVPRGAVYGLVGPNGAGKSTAIRCMVGVYRPDGGEVTVDGAAVYENPRLKARIGYIPDDIFYFPTATLEEMRQFYRGIYPDFDDALFARLYEIFRLPPKTPLRRFSKGMQKQAAFHLAICCRPEVLILDEPVDGLDPVMRRQVMSLILSDVGIMDHGKMLLEKSLADMQGTTHKLQMVGPAPEGLEVLHESASGRLNTYIVRGSAAQIDAAVAETEPVYYDVLPLSLEEIFICELGGVNDEVKNIIL